MYYIRCRSTSTTRVDPENDGLHGLISPGFPYGLGDAFRTDITLTCISIYYSAHGVDNCHFIFAVLFLLLQWSMLIVLQRHGFQVVLLFYAQFLFHEGQHLIIIDQTVDHACLKQLIRVKASQFIGNLVKLLCREATTHRDIIYDLTPEGPDISFDLFSVLFAEVISQKGFHRSFIATVPDHLHLYPDLLQGFSVEHHFSRHPVKQEHPFRSHKDTIGHRGQVIGFLGIGIRIGINKFPALFKIQHGFPDFSKGGDSSRNSTQFHKDSFDILIRFGLVQILQYLVQSHNFIIHEIAGKQKRKRILIGAVKNLCIELGYKQGVLFDFHRILGSGSSNNTHEDQKNQYGHDNQASNGCQKATQEIFHIYKFRSGNVLKMCLIINTLV